MWVRPARHSSDKCPECGLAIDRDLISISRIPWEHRREIGSFKAFWRTTRMVMFHPRQLAKEMKPHVRLPKRPAVSAFDRHPCVDCGVGWLVGRWLTHSGPASLPSRIGWGGGCKVLSLLPRCWPAGCSCFWPPGCQLLVPSQSVDNSFARIALWRSATTLSRPLMFWLPSVMLVSRGVQ